MAGKDRKQKTAEEGKQSKKGKNGKDGKEGKEGKRERKKFYVTTPIYYPTASPHLGNAYTTLAADVISRWYKLLGYDVFFLTGTDEHGQKLAEAAKKEGMEPKQYVDMLVEKFKEAWKKLNIAYDGFIRTTDKKHEEIVKKIIKKIYDNGDLYKGYYEGFYCIPCESYWTEKDLVDGKCPSCGREVTRFKEEAYFFRLSKYQQKLLELYRENPNFVLPETRMNEIVRRVEEGLRDVSFTRKTFRWGVEFPIDSSYVLWVWADALINYISGLDWPGEKFKKFWPADLHLIGKDILWFHAVIWPAMLLSAGIEPPKTIFAHGWWTVRGEKMSKSKGNIVEPMKIIEKYGVDSFRYFIFREVPFGQDGDFNEDAMALRHNNELANKLGNLVSRIAALIEKHGMEKTENKLLSKLKLEEIKENMHEYRFDKALALIFDFIDECNNYVQEKKPWESKDRKVLYELADSIRVIAILLSPFMPETAEKIAKQFGFEIKSIDDCRPGLLGIKKIKRGEILFKKV